MATLRRMALAAFVLFALVPLIHAACFRGLLKMGATHCQDWKDGTWHPVGSTWTNSACNECSCTSSYMSCCDGWPTRVSSGCSIEYDYKTCTYKLIHPDPTVPCGAVGK
ncbi:beta-microseminoprotein-like [Trichomycterus rosablanca]|uniref:beta-microseminoprotein-like n=1 Tax=Trichomycterus rosablanca TaxID=2290929 RepID=UPI002F352812